MHDDSFSCVAFQQSRPNFRPCSVSNYILPNRPLLSIEKYNDPGSIPSVPKKEKSDICVCCALFNLTFQETGKKSHGNKKVSFINNVSTFVKQWRKAINSFFLCVLQHDRKARIIVVCAQYRYVCLSKSTKAQNFICFEPMLTIRQHC